MVSSCVVGSPFNVLDSECAWSDPEHTPPIAPFVVDPNCQGTSRVVQPGDTWFISESATGAFGSSDGIEFTENEAEVEVDASNCSAVAELFTMGLNVNDWNNPEDPFGLPDVVAIGAYSSIFGSGEGADFANGAGLIFNETFGSWPLEFC